MFVLGCRINKKMQKNFSVRLFSKYHNLEDNINNNEDDVTELDKHAKSERISLLSRSW